MMVSSYIGVATGPWYEMGLEHPEGFGFDLRERQVTLYDRGETVKERFRRAERGDGMDRKAAFRMEGCARLFFPDESANFEKTKVTINSVAGLLKEIIDEATKVAIDLIDANRE